MNTFPFIFFKENDKEKWCRVEGKRDGLKTELFELHAFIITTSYFSLFFLLQKEKKKKKKQNCQKNFLEKMAVFIIFSFFFFLFVKEKEGRDVMKEEINKCGLSLRTYVCPHWFLLYHHVINRPSSLSCVGPKMTDGWDLWSALSSASRHQGPTDASASKKEIRWPSIKERKETEKQWTVGPK